MRRCCSEILSTFAWRSRLSVSMVRWPSALARASTEIGASATSSARSSGERRRVHELFDGRAQPLQRLVELLAVAAVAAVEHAPQPRAEQVEDERQHQGAAADPEGLLD